MRLAGHFLLVLIVSCAFFSSSTAQISTAIKAKDSGFKTVKAGKFTFSCKIDGENLVVSVSHPETCWVAVGFNPKNVMQNANIIIGAIVNGTPVVSDEYGDEMFSHKPDTAIGGTYNILSGDVTRENNSTTLSFTIPLDSKDPKDGALAAGKKIKVIFAAGAGGDFRKKHNDDARTIITLQP